MTLDVVLAEGCENAISASQKTAIITPLAAFREMHRSHVPKKNKTAMLSKWVSGDVMNRRIILALLFLIPVIWGAVSMTAALTASEAIICPGENVGEDGEERPGPMRPGDKNCSVLAGNQTVADRTYEMQQNTQRIDRKRNAVHGGLLIAYGALGLACILTVPSAGRAAKAH